jgi:hypothetical protein
MDSVSIQGYQQAGLSQDYQAYGGQRKRAQNLAEGAGNKLPNPAASATTQLSARPALPAQDMPQLSKDGAWRLVGVVQAQALSSAPGRLAELQPVASPQLVAATYA